MNHAFNEAEGLRIAVEMEKRGADFYRHAARISRDERARALLERLARDESEHEARFNHLYEARLAEHARDAEAWYDGESSAYLSAVAADVVFPGGLVAMGRDHGFDSPRAILQNAIQSEKDSILFYYEITEQTKCEGTRKVFSDIIREEKGHMRELQAMLTEVEA